MTNIHDGKVWDSAFVLNKSATEIGRIFARNHPSLTCMLRRLLLSLTSPEYGGSDFLVREADMAMMFDTISLAKTVQRTRCVKEFQTLPPV